MVDVLTVADVKGILGEISSVMDENKEYLCKLDSALGDGDIGLTMSKGFRAVKENLPTIAEDDIGVIFMKSAMMMGEKAASTSGTLMASALLRAGKVSKEKRDITLEDLVELYKAMVTGIMERGKAKLGDKTILDSFIPAVEALELAYRQGESLQSAMNSAYKAAEEGMKKTIEMQSRLGRAARYLEKSIGHQDPGATVGVLFIKGFLNFIEPKGNT